MKTTSLSLGLALAALMSFPNQSHAADADTVAASYDYFAAVRVGFGPMLEENGFEAPGLGTSGRFLDDTLGGVTLEAGAFLSPNLRISLEASYGQITHDRQIIDGVGNFRLKGTTDIYQGFVKLAYEIDLKDIGFESDFASKTAVYGIAGAGFQHISNDAVLLGTPFGDGVADGSDTVFAGKVGAGIAYKITETVHFISEYNFVFGGNADVTIAGAGFGGTETVTIGTNAHVLQFGIRVLF